MKNKTAHNQPSKPTASRKRSYFDAFFAERRQQFKKTSDSNTYNNRISTTKSVYNGYNNQPEIGSNRNLIQQINHPKSPISKKATFADLLLDDTMNDQPPRKRVKSSHNFAQV